MPLLVSQPEGPPTRARENSSPRTRGPVGLRNHHASYHASYAVRQVLSVRVIELTTW